MPRGGRSWPRVLLHLAQPRAPRPGERPCVAFSQRLAVFGKYIVAGYNNSRGFYNNTEGLSGFSYSTNGGNRWVDGGGLPPVIPGNGPGHDHDYGDPVLVVDPVARTLGGVAQPAGVFYYASI